MAGPARIGNAIKTTQVLLETLHHPSIIMLGFYHHDTIGSYSAISAELPVHPHKCIAKKLVHPVIIYTHLLFCIFIAQIYLLSSLMVELKKAPKMEMQFVVHLWLLTEVRFGVSLAARIKQFQNRNVLKQCFCFNYGKVVQPLPSISMVLY